MDALDGSAAVRARPGRGRGGDAIEVQRRLPWEDLDGTVGPLRGRQLAAVTEVVRLAARGDAARALDAVAAVLPCDAVALSAWDPGAGCHRPLAALGLPVPTAQPAHDPLLSDPGFRFVRARRIPLRRCDVPGADTSRLVVDVLAPAGFAEGVTACLYARDGRYAGVLNLATRSEEPASPAAMALLMAVRGALAELVDAAEGGVDANPAAGLAPELSAAVVHADGRCVALPGRPDCPLLRPAAPVLAEAWRRRPRDHGAQAFLWHADGVLWRVLVVRLRAERDRLLVAAEPTEVPLSLRELEVLAAVVAGCSNPAIAARLAISRRTVATHVEHILEKLGVAGRVEAAARAVRDGLVLGSVR